MQWDIFSFLFVNLTIIISSILQISTGVSVGMIVVPLLALVSYSLIPIPLIMASLLLTIVMAYKDRRFIESKNILQISFGLIMGIFVSTFILLFLSFDYIGIVFGIFILVSVYVSLKIKTFSLNYRMNYLGGFISGVMGTMAAVGGQILALMFQNEKLETVKPTLAFLYTIFSISMLVVLFLFGKIEYSHLESATYLTPGFVIGYLVAPKFSKYFNQKYTKHIIIFMAILGAFILIIKTIFEII